ncbi:hypothetical protein BKA93DRAFT_782774 [Sparassis latifolia]
MVLLVYLVFWKEPESYELRTHGAVLSDSRWTRCAGLAWKFPEGCWGVQAAVSVVSSYPLALCNIRPTFFWTFTGIYPWSTLLACFFRSLMNCRARDPRV